MIAARDLTIVLQGAMPADAAGRARLAGHVAALRVLLPGSPVVFSTWRSGGETARRIAADLTLFSDDPGELPAFKFDSCKPNNVNRQIVSSAAGLAAVETPYALKLRSDARLEHLGLLAWQARLQRALPAGAEPIVTASHFSIDPRMFEQMPFHFSDWFQLGRTERLRCLWSAPPMSPGDAVHYDSAAHAAHASLFDRRFRTRFPAEQHVWRHYAQGLGYDVPAFHNDTTPAVLDAHDRFAATEIAVLDAAQSGVRVQDYDWVSRSGLQRFNCLSHLDWQALAATHGALRATPGERRALQRRRAVKAGVARAARACSAAWPVLTTPPLKQVASVGLRAADRCSRWGSAPALAPAAPASSSPSTLPSTP